MAVCFLLCFPPRHRNRELPGTVPYSARTFLLQQMLSANVKTSPTGEELIPLPWLRATRQQDQLF